MILINNLISRSKLVESSLNAKIKDNWSENSATIKILNKPKEIVSLQEYLKTFFILSIFLSSYAFETTIASAAQIEVNMN